MLQRFFAYYRPHRPLFLLDFFCAVISGLLELVFPLAVKGFVDKLLPSQNWGLILGATAGLLAIYGVNTGLQYIVNYWGHVLGSRLKPKCGAKSLITCKSYRFGSMTTRRQDGWWHVSRKI